jgi:outer membrane protein TolC
MGAAETSAELARRMTQAGNFSRLAQLREQVFYAEATAELARAKQAALADRERLVRTLGLNEDAPSLKLPERLADLPAAARTPEEAITAAAIGRLDVQVARKAFDTTAASLGLTRGARFVSVFEAGYHNKSEKDAPRANGYELELQVPLFDWGDAKVARAETIYRQAAFRLAEATANAASEVRTGYQAYRTAYDLARHYQDEIVPLRRKISDENLLRYNGMLIGVFELLADARDQVASVTAAIAAKRDFWIADADLRLALTGGSPMLTPLVAPRTDSGGGATPAGH